MKIFSKWRLRFWFIPRIWFHMALNMTYSTSHMISVVQRCLFSFTFIVLELTVNILPNISFCVLQKKVSNTGLERHESE